MNDPMDEFSRWLVSQIWDQQLSANDMRLIRMGWDGGKARQRQCDAVLLDCFADKHEGDCLCFDRAAEAIRYQGGK